MPEKTNRTELIPVRVTPSEKALIQERAGGSRKVSAYLRKLALGGTDLRPKPEPGRVAPEHQGGDSDLERRVNALAQRMPRRNAEAVAKRQAARDAAKKLLRG